MTERPSWAPDAVDLTLPSIARVYDYYLGGSHNFAADRAFADRVLAAAAPGQVRDTARAFRTFLRRAVLHIGNTGIDQFLDLGAGIPTVGNVHEVAQEANPQAKIVYVDNDPVATTHGRAILAGNTRTTVVHADLFDHETVLTAATQLLDLDKPVGVLFNAVLHFVRDDNAATGIVNAYLTRVAPGSMVAISHVRGDTGRAEEAVSIYEEDHSPGQICLRSAARVEPLFGALQLVPPGVVDLALWHPELTGDPLPEGPSLVSAVGGVAVSR